MLNLELAVAHNYRLTALGIGSQPAIE